MSLVVHICHIDSEDFFDIRGDREGEFLPLRVDAARELHRCELQPFVFPRYIFLFQIDRVGLVGCTWRLKN
jgi:hypothetical protein